MRYLFAALFWLIYAYPNDVRADYAAPVACAQMPALTGSATTSAGSCATSLSSTAVPSGATLTDTINQEFTVSTSELDQSNTVTLATVTGLSIALTAAKTYSCNGHLSTASNGTAGIKVALVASNSLSATSASFTGFTWNGSTVVAQTTVTTLGSNIQASNSVTTDIYITGAIVVNAGGTINVQAAQNTQTSGSPATAKVFINSTFRCVRVN